MMGCRLGNLGNGALRQPGHSCDFAGGAVAGEKRTHRHRHPRGRGDVQGQVISSKPFEIGYDRDEMERNAVPLDKMVVLRCWSGVLAAMTLAPALPATEPLILALYMLSCEARPHRPHLHWHWTRNAFDP